MTRFQAGGAGRARGSCARALAETFAAVLACCAFLPAARAEFSGSVAAASDYRYRGVPLSDGNPSAQTDLNLDWQSWYLGVFAASARLGGYPQDVVQWLPYAGYTQPLASGAALDVGAQYSGFTGGQGYGYFEAQAGLTFDAFSLRVFVAPDYFHSEAHTLYLQMDGSRQIVDRTRIVDQVRLVGHGGCLQILSGGQDMDGDAPRRQCDLRAGLAAQWGRVIGQVSWVGVNHFAQVYPIRGYDGNSPLARNVWVVQLSASF